MVNILKKICEDKYKELEITKRRCSFKTLEKLISPKLEKREFKENLILSQKNKKNFIIGEVKKQSPSAGEIIVDYIPEEIAILYERSGVGALSILTESKYFLGNIDHLSLVKKKTNLPILRKDFIIDKYQVLESKIYQADCILLILTILSDEQAIDFISFANELKLDCIIEVHNEEELKRAIKIDYPIIGINNRNLKSLDVDLNNSINLNQNLTNDYILIAESGIKTSDDIKNFNSTGIYNFLIGETLLKSKDKGKKIGELLLNESHQ
tara:strand:- start:388 stop:1191 length:804 start_codon:yes stop_codon:yes gene_type:complete